MKKEKVKHKMWAVKWQNGKLIKCAQSKMHLDPNGSIKRINSYCPDVKIIKVTVTEGW